MSCLKSQYDEYVYITFKRSLDYMPSVYYDLLPDVSYIAHIHRLPLRNLKSYITLEKTNGVKQCE